MPESQIKIRDTQDERMQEYFKQGGIVNDFTAAKMMISIRNYGDLS